MEALLKQVRDLLAEMPASALTFRMEILLNELVVEAANAESFIAAVKALCEED